jgi:hypothetical protein
LTPPFSLSDLSIPSRICACMSKIVRLPNQP